MSSFYKKWLIFFFIISILCTTYITYYFWPKPPAPPMLVVEKIRPLTQMLRVGHYQELPHWATQDLEATLKAFNVSCRWFLKRDPEKEVGSDAISIKAKDWFDVCRAALDLKNPTPETIKTFFEHYFTPLQWTGRKNQQGLFTGYFTPLYPGSLHQTPEYSIPVYGLPDDLIMVQLQAFDPKLPKRQIIGRVIKHHMVPYYTREEISEGKIQDKAPVLVWMKNEVDRLFLEIQGAGTIQLNEGKVIPLGYAAENGKPYRSIARMLIHQGVMTKDNASMQHIRKYINAHPALGKKIINQNPSFVFFDVLDKTYTPGTQGLPLTAGYSMAVDMKWIPLGTPLWLSTQQPTATPPHHAIPLYRLMIAQDIGGAIKGKVRGDVYWGEGEEAGHVAGRMKHAGQYWMLLPKRWVKAHFNLT